jgi:TonB-dependent receptor
MVSAVINDNDFGSDNVEAEWNDEFAFFNGVEEEEIEVEPYTNVTEVREYLIQRVRRSFSANMDYQLNNNNKLYFKSMYNWRDDRENRFVLAQEILDAEDIEEGDFTITNGVPTRFPVEVSRETKGGIDGGRIDNKRLEDQRMQNYSVGGDHLFGSLKMNWMGSYAKASEERLNERYANFVTEYSIDNDNRNPRFPSFSPTNAADENNLENFEFDFVTEQNQFTEEEDLNFFADFELPVDFFGTADGTLKFGARGRFKNKFRDNDFFEFDLADTFPTLGATPTRNYTDADFMPGSQYRAGSFAEATWLGSLDLTSGGESVPDEFLRDNFEVKEDVWAGYVMANQKLTDKLGVLFGLRIENTNITATGNQIEEEENVLGTITEESSYTNILPGVHFKYDVTERTVLRFAWTNTLARPNYIDLTPTIDVILSDGEIFQGNPNLNPTTSMNFDLMAEQYYDNVGIISGGVFYKNIKDFVYTFIRLTSDDTFGPGTTGFELTQPQNGDNASIFGAEFSFQRQLDFLPGFARNFSIYANYTYLTSNANGIRNADGDEREDLGLPNTAPNMFNGSLGYAAKRFSSRLSANFSDAYIDEIGGRAFEDRYYDQQFFLDFNVTYAVGKNFTLYADLNNITNQPLRYYQGVRSRTQQMEYYNRRLTFGLKYDIFNKR